MTQHFILIDPEEELFDINNFDELYNYYCSNYMMQEGLLGNLGLPVIEIRPISGFYDYYNQHQKYIT